MRIQIVTDTWQPQINGVVRTLGETGHQLETMGHTVDFVGPEAFRTLPCPTYPQLRLAFASPGAVGACLERFRPDAVHIATEGPLGLAARRYCVAEGIPFTTSFHTRLPEYVTLRSRLPAEWGYAALRRFHRAARRTMVPTDGIRAELARRGFTNLTLWSHGVDVDMFRPQPKQDLPDPRPILLYVGRIAVEKNVTAFLDLDCAGTKYVVGDGPLLPALRRRYPGARFLGVRTGAELARLYANADVLVFPSLTDTFGNVLLEALACGVPVAAYPVTGPRDVLGNAPVGCLDADLAQAVRGALLMEPSACRAFAEERSWRQSAEHFLGNLVTLDRWQSLIPLVAA
jgi:glycosyltransferase involved in cell wall biosynthesis